MYGLISQTDITTTSTSTDVNTGALVVPLVLGLGLALLFIVAMWRIFTKIGEPGWKSLIPIYNIYVIFTRSGREGWMVLLFFIPCVNIIASWFMADSLGNLFGKSTGFKVGLFLLSPIFILILAFGSAQHVGAGAQPPMGGLPPTPPPPAPIG